MAGSLAVGIADCLGLLVFGLKDGLMWPNIALALWLTVLVRAVFVLGRPSRWLLVGLPIVLFPYALVVWAVFRIF